MLTCEKCNEKKPNVADLIINGKPMISMKECYICGRKTRIQYFDFVDGRFVLKEKCLNPYCRRYNKWAVK